MKKLFTFFLALVVSVGIIYASDTQVDGIWYDFNESNKTATVTYRGSSYNSYDNEYSGSVVIPSSVTYNGTTYSVTSIGEWAFVLCTSLTSVTIPNSITSIANAFQICTSLTSVTIGNSVTSIGNFAFNGCTSLTSVTIPNSVTKVGGGMFYGCSNLESIVLSENITALYDIEEYDHTIYGFFEGCSSLTSVTIPNSVTSIGNEAFLGCSSLTSINVDAYNSKYSSADGVLFNKDKTTLIAYPGGKQGAYTIPNSVTSIGSSAFAGCSSLASVTIPNSVTSIGVSAFLDCSSLTSVTIGNSVTSIEDYAFYECSSLTSVTINSDAIVNKAYTSSSNLSNIFGSQVTKYIIGDNVKGIGDCAFQDCSSLTSITIPNSVTSIGNYAFYNCSSLSSITIPNSVTGIGNFAFNGCSSLTSVTIGDGVTSIGNYAFNGCSSLTSINVNANNPNYCSIDGVLFNKDKTTLIAYPGGKQGAYTIPNSVTSIGSSAFAGCSSLASVTIPNSVTSIGVSAFLDCSSLTSVTIGNSVTSIGYCAFQDCSSLTSITIPNSVTSIGERAFCLCSSLTSVTIGDGVTSIGEYAFAWCYSLTSITIPNRVTSIGDYAFYYCDKLVDVYCYATTPPVTENESTFTHYNAFLYVPCESKKAYMVDAVWGNFKYIECIESDNVTTDEIVVTPSENEANVIWPSVSGAASYELVIKDKDGNIVCTLIFNANGQLTSIAFNAPSRNGAPAQTQNAGFSFTITGLDSGTGYDLTLTAKDNSGNIIEETTIPFHTDYPEGIEDISSSSLQGGDRGRLILRDGQVLILRGEKVYTIDGRKVR